MKVLVLVLLVAAVYAKHEKYSGWKSYYVSPSSLEQIKILGHMATQFDLDFVSFANLNQHGVVLVKPEYQAGFSKALADNHIPYKVNSADVKSQLDIDDLRMEKQKEKEEDDETLSYDNYYSIEVIDKYLQDVAEKYSEVVTLVSSAKSFEGHPIQYLKISSSNFQNYSKPVIFINGGISARDWIAPPTVTYAIHKLVEDLTETDLLEDFDWILFPVVNPDGYIYTSTDRFWHKTRSTDQHILSKSCPGVDIDLNFDFYWGTVGVNHHPCYENYPGGGPFSEVETRVVRDILLEYELRITLYLSMHSYGSTILYPWGHDGTLSMQALALHTVGINMADAISAKKLDKFNNYVVGNSATLMGARFSGSTEDYAHNLGIPLTYHIELPGLDGGLQGFHLPPEYIKQVVEETWAAIVVGARRSRELFGVKISDF